MAVKKLFSVYDTEGNLLSTLSENVYDKTSKQTLAQFIANSGSATETAIEEALNEFKDGDFKDLSDNVDSLETTLNTFLEGDEDGGDLDRLKELVKAIGENKDSIDALTSDKVNVDDIADNLTTDDATKVLSAKQGKALDGRVQALETDTHTHDNKAVLDGITADDSTKNLKYNGVELNGETGIAIGANLAAATDYHNKIRLVIEEVTIPDPSDSSAQV